MMRLMKLKRLYSTDDAIEILGGTKKVMMLTGKGATTLSWWRRNNRFPGLLTTLITLALEREGYEPDASILTQVAETEAAE
jgi:hypothetical protein